MTKKELMEEYNQTLRGQHSVLTSEAYEMHTNKKITHETFLELKGWAYKNLEEIIEKNNIKSIEKWKLELYISTVKNDIKNLDNFLSVNNKQYRAINNIKSLKPVLKRVK